MRFSGIDLSLIDITPKGPLDRLSRWLLRHPLTIRVMWRHLSGRLHCWRDAPAWLVVEWAIYADAPGENDDLQVLTREALREFELRVDRVKRQIEQLKAVR